MPEIELQQASTTPSVPASGYWLIYMKSTGLYLEDSSGNVYGPWLNVQEGSVSTTDATVTTVLTYTIPATTTVDIEARVVARRTGGSSGTAEDGAGYNLFATVKNVAGTATLIGSVQSITAREDQAGWDATIDVTGATARVRITGATNNNVDWYCRAEIIKVS